MVYSSEGAMRYNVFIKLTVASFTYQLIVFPLEDYSLDQPGVTLKQRSVGSLRS